MIRTKFTENMIATREKESASYMRESGNQNQISVRCVRASSVFNHVLLHNIN